MASWLLDATIHPIPRLSICAALAGADWAEFSAVRDVTELTDSALSKNARVLEETGYVELRKGKVGRRPRTWLRLTPLGRAALDKHVGALAELVSGHETTTAQ